MVSQQSATRGIARNISRGAPQSAGHSVSHETETKKEGVKEEEPPLLSPEIIAPLAPLPTGLTVSSQPTLYWYLSSPWDGEVEFTLNEVGAMEPILELIIGPPANSKRREAGVHATRLSDYNITLDKDKDYEWFAVIVSDPGQRSGDSLGSAIIKHVEPSPKLTERLKNTPKEQWQFVYAEEGIWYEMIDVLCQLLEAHPNDQKLREQRAGLMEQVKMPKVAVYDKKPKKS
jgi:hypothetical protein